MKPEEQRIAIAEACGWIRLETGGWRKPDGSVENSFYGEEWRLPDYLNDLNAMHEAENVLTKEQRVEMYLILQEDWQATASQRAEAFLRTINKWKN